MPGFEKDFPFFKNFFVVKILVWCGDRAEIVCSCRALAMEPPWLGGYYSRRVVGALVLVVAVPLTWLRRGPAQLFNTWSEIPQKHQNITRCVRACGVRMCVFARTCAYLCCGVYLLLSGPCVLLRMSSCSASCVVTECVPPFAVFCMCSFLSLSILRARPRALFVIMYRSYCICVGENMRARHAHAHTDIRTPTRTGRCGYALIVRANTKISQPQRFWAFMQICTGLQIDK